MSAAESVEDVKREKTVAHKSDEEPPVAEIAASSIRSGLAELELKTSQVLQRLENVVVTNAAANASVAAAAAAPTNSDINSENSNDTIGASSTGTAATATAATATNDNNAATVPVVSRDRALLQLKAQLANEHKMPSDILKLLEQIVAYSENDDDPEFPLPALDDVSHLALISHSITAYLSHLDEQNLIRVTNDISSDTTSWLGTLFHFNNASSSFHTDHIDSMLRVARLALVTRCPGYLEGGVPALANPCFYISNSQTSLRLQYVVSQLGLSLDVIKVIPAKGKQGTMDVAALQKQIQNDIAANRTPLLLFADLGESLCGYVDNLSKLHELCTAHNIWLHASGHALAALACAQNPGIINNMVHSASLNLGNWLGVPSLPIVLLHRPMHNTMLSIYELDPIRSRRLKSLSLWTTLQALGRKAIAQRVFISFQTCDIILGIVSKCKGVRILSPTQLHNRIPLSETLNPKAAFDVDAILNAATPVIAFQFDGSLDESETVVAAATTPQSQNQNQKYHSATYFDRLNLWLGQILQRDCPNLNLDVIEHTTRGSCIRFCALEQGLGEQAPTSEQLENFAQSLETHVDILRATIKHKVKFMHLVDKHELLRIVPLPDWAGMGGVRFVPEGWESLLTDQAKTELNKLNVDLVETLKSTDNAFSLGESSDGLICVRFGMVTHETEVEELLDLVVTVGMSVQENSRVLDTMSEIVKKGIEAATADLQRETEEKLWQDGILRNVPVFGRVFNWWSPASKESGIKGRSLNLTQGVVESTENIYKYHMQMSGATAHQLPANRSPPTPMVQTPVATTANNVPPVFPTVEPVLPTPAAAAAPAAAANTTGAQNGTSTTAAAATTTTSTTTTTTATANKTNDENHERTVSQSSTSSSSVPELVAVNNVINNN